MPNDTNPAVTHKRIGLALGGGGARGLAHIIILEAFDELGIKPAIIAGSSMGALVGAAYASGVSAKDLKAYSLETLKSKRGIARRLFGGRGRDFLKLLDFSLRTPPLVDGSHLIDLFLPPGVADDFNELAIELKVIATDFYHNDAKVFDTGPLRPALAASIALPGLLTPLQIDGRLMIDGAIVNPLPFDVISGKVDYVAAIDVTGKPIGEGDDIPSNIDLIFKTTQIMQHQIIEAKLLTQRVDILIRPDIDQFRVLDFHKVRDIFNATQRAKDELKRMLESIMTFKAF